MDMVRSLKAFLDAEPVAALVEVAGTKGSTPREKGAWMLVSPAGTFGTIGGGQLEYMAIDEARKMLTVARSKDGRTLDIPLGPEIGQCCGGRVEVSVRLADAPVRERLLSASKAEDDALPRALVFGGGHVGHALAASLSLLPVRVEVIDTRADALEDMPAGVRVRLAAVPEEAVRDAPAGTAFLVLTHDHALDFLIVAEALARRDAAYVGMIGSATKKATFRSWYLRTAGGTDAAFRRLVCPIGGSAVKDKRPAVIAALAAAEVMTALAQYRDAPAEARARQT